MNYEWIWFDLGNTLVYMKREEILKNALLSFNIEKDLEDIDLACHKIDKLFMRKYQGLLSKPQDEFMSRYFEYLSEILEIDVKVCNSQELLSIFYYLQDKQMNKDGRLWFVNECTMNVLRILKYKKMKLGIISNWDSTARDILKSNQICDFFDEIIISSEVGIEKPNPNIFLYALKVAKIQPQKCLYVGDNYYDDWIGSKKAGMNTLILNPYGRIGIEELNINEVIPNIESVFEYID